MEGARTGGCLSPLENGIKPHQLQAQGGVSVAEPPKLRSLRRSRQPLIEERESPLGIIRSVELSHWAKSFPVNFRQRWGTPQLDRIPAGRGIKKIPQRQRVAVGSESQ